MYRSKVEENGGYHPIEKLLKKEEGKRKKKFSRATLILQTPKNPRRERERRKFIKEEKMQDTTKPRTSQKARQGKVRNGRAKIRCGMPKRDKTKKAGAESWRVKVVFWIEHLSRVCIL
jgi:hypothetical protein